MNVSDPAYERAIVSVKPQQQYDPNAEDGIEMVHKNNDYENNDYGGPSRAAPMGLGIAAGAAAGAGAGMVLTANHGDNDEYGADPNAANAPGDDHYAKPGPAPAYEEPQYAPDEPTHADYAENQNFGGEHGYGQPQSAQVIEVAPAPYPDAHESAAPHGGEYAGYGAAAGLGAGAAVAAGGPGYGHDDDGGNADSHNADAHDADAHESAPGADQHDHNDAVVSEDVDAVPVASHSPEYSRPATASRPASVSAARASLSERGMDEPAPLSARESPAALPSNGAAGLDGGDEVVAEDVADHEHNE